MPEPVDYQQVASAIAPTGMFARGGFLVDGDANREDDVPTLPGDRPARTVVIIGNSGDGAMWDRFRRDETAGPDPLDRWTRSVLQPIADALDAMYLHPSDEPFRPFQRWARRADDVWQSPIGLLIHPDLGLWHAYRGAFLFATELDGLPSIGSRTNPCLSCVDQPCLTTCPVAAFTADGYDSQRCAGHVRSGSEPACLDEGCAARRACPVEPGGAYGPDQMRFHMAAFVGMRT